MSTQKYNYNYYVFFIFNFKVINVDSNYCYYYYPFFIFKFKAINVDSNYCYYYYYVFFIFKFKVINVDSWLFARFSGFARFATLYFFRFVSSSSSAGSTIRRIQVWSILRPRRTGRPRIYRFLGWHYIL